MGGKSGDNEVDLLECGRKAIREESDTGSKKFTQEHGDAAEPVNLDDVTGHAELFDGDTRPRPPTSLPNIDANGKPSNQRTR
ncbi:hypothetical protein Tco_1515081 [Tanacetum coccineum]